MWPIPSWRQPGPQMLVRWDSTRATDFKRQRWVPELTSSHSLQPYLWLFQKHHYTRLGLISFFRIRAAYRAVCYSLASFLYFQHLLYSFPYNYLVSTLSPFSIPNPAWGRLALFWAGKVMGFLSLESFNHKGVAGSLNIPVGSISRSFFSGSGDTTVYLDPQWTGWESLTLWLLGDALGFWAPSEVINAALWGQQVAFGFTVLLLRVWFLFVFDFFASKTCFSPVTWERVWFSNGTSSKFLFSPVQHQKHHCKLETYSRFVSFYNLYVQILFPSCS